MNLLLIVMMPLNYNLLSQKLCMLAIEVMQKWRKASCFNPCTIKWYLNFTAAFLNSILEMIFWKAEILLYFVRLVAPLPS